MSVRRLTPEIEALEVTRLALVERMRWLGPNARRRRELFAEHQRITRRVLELEVKLLEGRVAQSAPDRVSADVTDPAPRMWWLDRDG